jgi:L-seryl-tRNA(Ser) seleniumtransferase
METDTRKGRFRNLPSVDTLLADPALAGYPRELTADCAREALAAARLRIAADGASPDALALRNDIVSRMEDALRPPLRPLINATGVVLHTNLGRAPLAPEAVQAMAEASRSYSNLEYDLARGERGSRHSILEPLLCRLTGAEAAMAVNNNAAAVLLALSALCAGREVVVSRGQLVEIGGGFRIPDVMRQSRAKLVEVGATNRTRIADYAVAVGTRTAAIMRVHASNFRIVGFTEQATLAELAELAADRELPLIDDLGSGCLLDTTAYGLPPEPRPQDSVAAGAAVVMFSGDKLLGGPQAGLVVGAKDAIARMKRHPLARAVRLDKASIAGMAATLRLYVEGRAAEALPVWRMLGVSLPALRARAEAIAAATGGELAEGRSMVGGGALPEEGLPTALVVLGTAARSARALSARLRESGVVARIEDDRVLLDPRTVLPGEDDALIAAVSVALA